MPALRYNEDPYAGMPDYLRSTAAKNLATEDASISKFNSRARMFPTPTGVTQPSPVQRSSFNFTLNGGNDPEQLSLNGIPSSATANGVPQSSFTQPSVAANPADSNWRLRGFSGSSNQPFDQVKSQGLLPSGLTPVSHAPGATVTSPDATPTSPDAYHQVISTYQPKDMSKERQQYGWGGQ